MTLHLPSEETLYEAIYKRNVDFTAQSQGTLAPVSLQDIADDLQTDMRVIRAMLWEASDKYTLDPPPEGGRFIHRRLIGDRRFYRDGKDSTGAIDFFMMCAILSRLRAESERNKALRDTNTTLAHWTRVAGICYVVLALLTVVLVIVTAMK